MIGGIIMLECGVKAPDFSLLNQDGKKVALSDFKGKKIIHHLKDNAYHC